MQISFAVFICEASESIWAFDRNFLGAFQLDHFNIKNIVQFSVQSFLSIKISSLNHVLNYKNIGSGDAS